MSEEAEDQETDAVVVPLPGAVAAQGATAAANPQTRDLAAVLMAEQIEIAILQRHHLHLQHARDRLLLAFDFALAIGGVVVVVIIGALFWDAWTSRSVIVEPFDVPASFASAGVTGKVVASELLDRLKSFQDATRSNQEKRAVEDAWSNKIELQIPEAGISIADVQALLHRWLSHDEHISGSVVDQGKHIVLTIRGDGFAARSFAGPGDALDALGVRAAEHVYGSSEPYLFSVYLLNQGRDAEVIRLARDSFSTASATDKPLLLNVWSNALADQGHYGESLDKVREAVRLDPDFWLGYDNMMGSEMSLGEEGNVIRTGTQMERRARRGGWFAARVPPGYWQNLDYVLNDWTQFHRDVMGDMAENGGRGTDTAEDAPIDAEALARMHDWRGTELELETSPSTKGNNYVTAQSAFARALIALDAGDFAHAAASMRIADGIAAKDSTVAANIAAPWACWLALADARAGQGARVDADIARGGHFVDCLRFKGDIADMRGDWAGAQKDYAAAVSLAPSIPSSYESWGEALMRHGQRRDARQKFALAHQKGPHWADPLEHWGEAMASDGKLQDAAAKYEAAAGLAPNWGRLYLEWGRALAGLHRHSDALEKYRRALSLDLSSADRAALAGCCGG
ncbi:MAG TPA: hypothetical protein VGL35_11395 [Rhizomicrobium sp.]